jgi:hypothetical protein
MEWQPITTAPFDRDLELAVIDYEGPHSLVFPGGRQTSKATALISPVHSISI